MRATQSKRGARTEYNVVAHHRHRRTSRSPQVRKTIEDLFNDARHLAHGASPAARDVGSGAWCPSRAHGDVMWLCPSPRGALAPGREQSSGVCVCWLCGVGGTKRGDCERPCFAARGSSAVPDSDVSSEEASPGRYRRRRRVCFFLAKSSRRRCRQACFMLMRCDEKQAIPMAGVGFPGVARPALRWPARSPPASAQPRSARRYDGAPSRARPW